MSAGFVRLTANSYDIFAFAANLYIHNFFIILTQIASVSEDFVTERWEAELVFGMFEKGGQLAYKDFFSALKDKKEPQAKKPKTITEQLQHQVCFFPCLLFLI